ncbi:MAG: DUF2058 domain-containing protein [Granulosicoccus sp.]|nr:DUF2058 domain-containing protein [Granulosicoccus sp.]
MGNSLQDQLLKAGVANRKQAVKARKAINHKEKQKRSGAVVVDETEQRAEAMRQEKVARDRELNQQKQAAAEQKAIQAQIKQLVEMNRVEERGDVEFRFTHGTTVKTLLVQESQRKALVAGKLGIVKLEQGVELVPSSVARKIAERDSSWIILCHDAEPSGQSHLNDEDDPYADYQVPDDMMW